LELAAVKMSKPQYNSPRGKTSRVDTERDEQHFNGYLPQRNFLGVTIEPNKNKTQASIKAYNKNRVSAEREGEIGGKSSPYGTFLPLSKVFSTFTLMYLIFNKGIYLIRNSRSEQQKNILLQAEL
jgi:hypothetical protein